MSPMVLDEPNPVSRRDAWKTLPEPIVHPVKEVKFEKFVAPQTNGRETAKAQPGGNAAIVIDYGELNPFPIRVNSDHDGRISTDN